MSMTPAEARGFAAARLRRDPQDMLEAAVVLEAWAGVPAGVALPLSSALMEGTATAPQASRSRQGVAGRPQQAAEALALAATVLAVCCWATPLAAVLGAGLVQHGVLLALPATFALQWALRGHPPIRHAAHTAARRFGPLAAAIPIVAFAPLLALGRAGVLALLLTATWTGGALLARRGGAAAYALAVAAATGAMLAGVRGDLVLLVLAAVVVVGVSAWSAPALEERPPGGEPWPWSRALVAAAIGAGLGGLMVSDGSIDWAGGPAAAFVLLPSSLGSLWGGLHLWHLPRALAGGLAGIPVFAGGGHRAAALPTRVLAGAVARVVVLTVALSGVVAAAGPALGVDGPGPVLLAAFGLVALATLLAGLLEAVGRARWALGTVVLGLVVEVTLAAALPGVAGLGLLAGGGTIVALCLPAVVSLLLRPAETLATTLYVA